MNISKRISVPALTVWIAIMAFIGVLSAITAWGLDDIYYAFHCSTRAHIETFGDIISSQNYHYLHSNGRYVAHVLVQLFCGILGHVPFAVVNALAYGLFFALICRLAGIRRVTLKSALSVAGLVLFAFQTKMTPSCQIGYIWMFDLVMLFLAAFFSKKKSGIPALAGLALMSLAAGNSQEALTPGICGAIVVYWIIHRREFTIKQYVMAIAFGVGTLTNCLAPSTVSRGIGAATSDGLALYQSVYTLLGLRCFMMMCAVILWQRYRRKTAWRKMLHENAFLLIAVLFLLSMNVCISPFGNRQFFGIELLSIIVMLRILRYRSLTVFWLCALWAALAVIYPLQTISVVRERRTYDEIARQYASSQDGRVFIDIYSPSYVPATLSLTSGVIGYNRQNMLMKSFDNAFTPFCVGMDMAYRYPGRGPLKFYPKELRAYIDKHLCTQAVILNRREVLLIQDKDDEPARLAMPDGSLLYASWPMEGKHWKAYHYVIQDYVPHAALRPEMLHVVLEDGTPLPQAPDNRIHTR